METYSQSPDSASMSVGGSSSFGLSPTGAPTASFSGSLFQSGATIIAKSLNALGIVEVASRLGLTWFQKYSVGPCPVCKAVRRDNGGTRGKGAIGIRPSTNSWECHRCKANGDPAELVSWELLHETSPRVFEKWQLIQTLFFGSSAEFPPIRTRTKAPAYITYEPPKLPPTNEVAALWDQASPLPESSCASEWITSRGLDPKLLAENDLARVLPKNSKEPLPNWAVFGKGLNWAQQHLGRPWDKAGYAVLLPLYDQNGQLASLRARTLNQARDLPKEICPKDHAVNGLVFANANARAILLGQPSTLPIVICEGGPDFLTWATRLDLAVFGVFPGGWTNELAARIPAGSRVVFRYHQDKNAAGEKIAAKVLDTLQERCQTFFPAYVLDPTNDDNDRLRAGTLPKDPFVSSLLYQDTKSRNLQVQESYQAALFAAFLDATKDPALNLTDGRAALFTALAQALQQDGITVLHGDCGVGKTTALVSFAKELARQGKTVLLAFPTLKLARAARDTITDVDTELYFSGPNDERCEKTRRSVLAHIAAGFTSGEICGPCPKHPKNGGKCPLALGKEGANNAAIRICTHQGIAAAAKGVDVLFIDEAAAPSEVKTLEKKALQKLAASPAVLAGGLSHNGTRQTLALISQALLDAIDQVATFEFLREELVRLAQEDHGKVKAKVLRAQGAEPNGDNEHHATFTDDTAHEVLQAAHHLLEAAVIGAKVTPTQDGGLCFVANTPLAKVIKQLGRAVLVSATPHDPKRLEAATGLAVRTVRIRLKDNAQIFRTLFADKSGTLKALAPHGRADFEKKELKRAIAYLVQWLKDNPIQRLLLGSYKPVGLAVLLAWKERHLKEPTETERRAWNKIYDGNLSAAQKALNEASLALTDLFDLLVARQGELGVVWYGDEAGSNAFTHFDAVATLGDAFPNLDAARRIFAQAYAREELPKDGDAEFQRFYEDWARSAISQTHGRLRDAVREKTGYHFHFGRLVPQGWSQVQTFAKAPGSQKFKNLTSGDVANPPSPDGAGVTQGWDECIRGAGGMRALSKLLGLNRSTLENYAYGRRQAPTELLEKLETLKKEWGGHGLATKTGEPAPAPQVNPEEGGYSQAVATTKTPETEVEPQVFTDNTVSSPGVSTSDAEGGAATSDGVG